MKKKLIISVNLEYDLPDNIKTFGQVDDFMLEIPLPENYVEDTIDFVKVWDEEKQLNVMFK